jgi:hypothetical protein
MSTTKNIVALALLVAAFALLAFSLQQPQHAFSSVITGGEYQATTTGGLPTGHQVVRGSLTTLGSVVIASSSATSFTIWNATSTTDTASTSLVTFEADAAEGTYTFDIDLVRGLVVEEPSGFNGDFVVTWRAQ